MTASNAPGAVCRQMSVPKTWIGVLSISTQRAANGVTASEPLICSDWS